MTSIADCQTAYETDYLQWIETTAEKLRRRNYNDVDWENLIEEIEDMGKSERRRLESNLMCFFFTCLNGNTNPNVEAEAGKALSLSIADVLRKP